MGVPNSQPEEIRALIGVLPESYGFPTAMAGADILTFMGQPYGQSKKRAV